MSINPSAMINDLKQDFWGTLARWQDQRPLWLLGGSIALFMEIFSWAFFQTYLGLNPCELCVYIRFSMVAIFLGAMIGAVNPANIWFKSLGYLVVVWGIVRGLVWNVRLEMENIRSAVPGYFSPCRPGKAEFPFDLPLQHWFPSHFLPLASCGEDSAWSFLGLTMPEWLFFVYVAFILGVGAMLAAWLGRRLGIVRPPKLRP